MHVSHRSAIEQMQTLMRGLEVENTRLRQRVDALTAEGKERAGETTPLRAGQHAALLLRIAELEAAAPSVPIGPRLSEAISHLDGIREHLWQLQWTLSAPAHLRFGRWLRRWWHGLDVTTAPEVIDRQIDRIDTAVEALIELQAIARTVIPQ